MNARADPDPAQPPATPPAAGHAADGPLLVVDGLSKRYGTGPTSKLAIEDVTFSVHEGEFVSIVGPSGAGKTTLLKCLSGLMPATGGVAEFQGAPIRGTPANMALVFQDYSRSLLPWMTVEGNVGLPLKAQRVPSAQRRQRVHEALTAVGLEDSLRRYPWQLSGGMQQRVALARAVAYRPASLLLDEPFASVDAQTRFELEDLVLQLRREFGMTVLFVTHDVDEAVYVSDRIVVLSKSPCRVTTTLTIDLPRPRDQIETRSSARFAELRTELLESVRGGRAQP